MGTEAMGQDETQSWGRVQGDPEATARQPTPAVPEEPGDAWEAVLVERGWGAGEGSADPERSNQVTEQSHHRP